MELPEFDMVLLRLRVIIMSTAAITANMSINPATEIAIAKLRCDTQIASSGVWRVKEI